ncbi:S8 family serine peptidase [Peribacillus alkalitolerans]|uniref:S8 family serine peptidase n=1 Tax=Peribacillus alkalitolerans TaxID=1550385 RepID=UPI0013D1069D|nr:S8 family serine peptidase [Peribacillus alkalitolerans]
MKLSKKDWLGRVVKGSAVAVIALGVLFPPFQSGHVSAKSVTNKSEQILASLTNEQLNALNKLQAAESFGLHGFKGTDLKSDEEISVILEFKSMPEKAAVLDAVAKGKNLSSKEAKDKVDREHSTFKDDLKRISQGKSRNASYKVTRSFKTAYNGVAMNLPANEVESLLQSDAVKAVYKNATFTIEPSPQSDTDAEQESTKRIESIPFLGVDKLHKEGITGKGVKVGVIDTGIDYTHPDLKDAFKGGYDLVDNDADPMETTYDDWKKSGRPEVDQNLSPYYTSHGTHVSGTISGQAKNTGGVAVKGIAPDAELYGYRVLGPYGTGELQDILAGIDKAVTDGMDVINLSLGININDPLYPTSTAVNYAVLNGVTAVVSAGNNGSNSYTLGSPGSAALALTVGASSAPIPVAKYTGVLTGSETDYALSNLYSDFVSDLSVFNNQTLEVVDLGVGRETDYLNKDVTGKVVFVNTGEIGTQSKTVYAKNHGARAIIAYSNQPNKGPTPFVKEDQNFIPAFSMSYEQGLELKAQLAVGHTALTFKNYKEELTEGDKLATFSSRGPSRSNYDIKPEFTAPGVSVLSSVPAYSIYKNDPSNYQYAYTRMSGTSMAAPHVAGISALLLQVNPDLQPSDIKSILMNTAKPLTEDYSVFEVGAGRVDPYRAVHTGMKLQVQDETQNENSISIKEETGGLSFGNHYTGEELFIEKTVNMTNLEDKKKKFEVAVEFQTDVKGSMDAKANDVKVDVAQVIPVQSFKTKKVPVSITVPANAKAGIYEGYLMLTNQEDEYEQYRIPFSIRTTEDGFNLTKLSYDAISPPYLHVKRNYGASASAEFIANFKAPMKRLEFVLVDGKSGEDIGYLGWMDTVAAYDGLTYNFGTVFDGTYFPFTGNEEESISFKKSYAKPGLYKIKVIGTSERDRMFTNEIDLFIDHNSPTMTTSLDENESPVIEYQPGQTTVPLQVKLTDDEAVQMKEAGMNVTQPYSLNYSINGNFNPVLPIGEDGTISLNVPMNESNPFLRYTVNGLDAAKNTTDKRNYYFVKAGTPYGYMKTDNMKVKMGDTVSAALVLNNIDKLKTAEWTLSNIGQSFEIVEVKADDKLSEFGASQVTVETTGNTSKVKLTMEGTVSGDIPAIQLTLKVKDSVFASSAAVNPTVLYTNELGNRISLSSAGMEWMIQPTFSEVYGTLRAEAIAYNADWRKLGASIQLIDENGTKYDGSSSVAIFGDYRISKLPITDKPFVWELSVPGHFKMTRELPVGVEKKGVLWGQLLQYFNFNERSVAGDVNQDDVIDIKDAQAIQQAWNSNDRAADINYDGKVDAKDMEYVVKNYLKQNLDSDNPPVPVEQVDGKSLQDILIELQINS